MQAEFETMIAPARRYPQIWRLMAGIFTAFLIFGVFYIPFKLLLMKFHLRASIEIEIHGSLYGAAASTVVLHFLMIAFLLPATLGAAKILQKRNPVTLFGAWREMFGSFFTTLMIALSVYLIFSVIQYPLAEPVRYLKLSVWLLWAPMGVIAILLQVTGEELFFRGYLAQQLAARFNSRVIWMILPSVLFAFLHYKHGLPELKWIIVISAFLLAIFAADLTERTGDLGAAIAIHFVGNFSGTMLISIKGYMSGLALWVTPYKIQETDEVALLLFMKIAVLVIIWRLARWALERRLQSGDKNSISDVQEA